MNEYIDKIPDKVEEKQGMKTKLSVYTNIIYFCILLLLQKQSNNSNICAANKTFIR